MGKIFKKKASKKTANGDSDDDMMSSAINAPDIDADYKVADLSSIAAPTIEFQMPNLTPLDATQPKQTKKVKAAKPAKANPSQKAVLTAGILNNEVVKMRTVVTLARSFLKQTLVRRKKSLVKKTKSKPDDKVAKRIAKLNEDIDLLKDVDKDAVVKFALLNKKTRDQLTGAPNITADEHCLYLLATEKTILAAVAKYRSTYDNAEVMTAYLLQRFGAQYSDNVEMTRKMISDEVGKDEPLSIKKVPKAKEPKVVAVQQPVEGSSDDEGASDDEESDNDSEEGDGQASSNVAATGSGDVSEDDDLDDEDEQEEDSSDDDEEFEFSDDEMGTDSEDDTELAKKRRELLFGAAGIQFEKNRPLPVPKKKVIKESDDEEEEETAAVQPVEEPEKKKSKKTPKTSKSSAAPANTTESPKDLRTKLQEKMEAIQRQLMDIDPEVAKPKKAKKADKVQQKHQSFFVKPVATQQLKASEAVLPEETFVKQIKLSQGGRIKSDNSNKRVMDRKILSKDDDSSDGETPVSTFFLSAGSSSSNTTAGNGDADDGSNEQQPRSSSFNKKSFDSTEVRSNPYPKREFGQGGGRGGRGGHQGRGGGGDRKRPQQDSSQSFNKKPRGGGCSFDQSSRNAPAGKNKPVDTEELHPSWAARLQNKKNLSAAPQGKRITFDD